jgi:hypothetical protein
MVTKENQRFLLVYKVMNDIHSLNYTQSVPLAINDHFDNAIGDTT